MKKLSLYLIVFSLCLLSFGACNKKQSEAPDEKILKLGWKELKGLDPATGKMAPLIQDANGKEVKIAGFVTPLTDDAAQIFEFTLVPYPVSCVHTPPPPPNQIVLVTLENSHINPEDLWHPFWVYGTQQIDQTQNEFFTASYKMTAHHIEKYE